MTEKAAVETLFMTDMAALRATQQAELATHLPSGCETIILFGAGELGRVTAARVAALHTKYQFFICDNNPAVSGEIAGIQVLPKAEAIARYATTALFVVTIYNPSVVIEQLKAAGCTQVIAYPTLYRAYPAMMPHCVMAAPEPIHAEAEAVRHCYDLWADEASRNDYLNILRWHLSPRYETLPRPHETVDTYFPADLFALTPSERFVDCGAYDGNDIRRFIERAGGGFDRIATFEPDEKNFPKLTTTLAAMPEDQRARITAYPYALSDSAKQIRFSATGSVASTTRAEDGSTVTAVTLDETLGDLHPTFIKMDIEGAEPEALRGAANILRQDAPILAICLYHDIAHLWQIPLLIHTITPAYRLHLRRYSEDCWETVCYAIPPGRTLGQ